MCCDCIASLPGQTKIVWPVRLGIEATDTHLQVSGPVSINHLHTVAQQRGAIRAGSTIDPKQRARQYAQEGYSGTLYYASTENMMKAENTLFEKHTFRHNVHSRSNSPQDPGYVYVIKGKKFSNS